MWCCYPTVFAVNIPQLPRNWATSQQSTTYVNLYVIQSSRTHDLLDAVRSVSEDNVPVRAAVVEGLEDCRGVIVPVVVSSNGTSFSG